MEKTLSEFTEDVLTAHLAEASVRPPARSPQASRAPLQDRHAPRPRPRPEGQVGGRCGRESPVLVLGAKSREQRSQAHTKPCRAGYRKPRASLGGSVPSRPAPCLRVLTALHLPHIATRGWGPHREHGDGGPTRSTVMGAPLGGGDGAPLGAKG